MEKRKSTKKIKKYKRKKYVPLPKFSAPWGRSSKVNNLKPQVCSNRQAKIDQRLHKRYTKGLEALNRMQLNRVAKRHKVKTFQKKSDDIIKELRVIAKGLK